MSLDAYRITSEPYYQPHGDEIEIFRRRPMPNGCR